MTPNKVRIIGGSLRNSRLAIANVEGLRPSADRVRETLFNWLAPRIAGARVLDWFAGTGALGIEAISRGAVHVDFVESAASAVQALTENIQRLKIGAHARVHDGRAPQLLPKGVFDLVLMDPPFALNLWTECVQALRAAQAISAQGLIYLEMPTSHTWPDDCVCVKQSRAGAVQFGLFQLR